MKRGSRVWEMRYVVTRGLSPISANIGPNSFSGVKTPFVGNTPPLLESKVPEADFGTMPSESALNVTSGLLVRTKPLARRTLPRG